MKHSKRWMVKFSYRFWVCLVVLALSAGLIGSAPLQAAPAALVQVELQNDSQMAALAEIGVPVYTSLYRADGSLAVIALANPDQQQALAARGFDVQVLEAAPQPEGIYGLYGLPDALTAVSKDFPLLAVVENQAIARLTEAQRPAVEAAGVMTQPLISQAPTAPVVRPEALAEAAAPALVYNPLIHQMANGLSQSTLNTYVAQLTGAQPAIVGGISRTLVTRYTLNEQYINWATRFVFEHMAGLGLAVGYDYYNMTYAGVTYQKRNVVAEQPGVVDPSRIVLVTAHLDSYSGSSSWSNAPGADDNATGSAAVMAIADILSQYTFAYTIRYVLYTGEEEGLFGSWAYSADVHAAGDNIVGVLNLDMLGYENFGPPNIELHTRPGNSGDLAIANLFAEAVYAYIPAGTLVPLVLQDGKSFSDHYPFWQRGYHAIMAIEDWNDHTPAYHTVNDTLATLNMPYYTAFSRASLATFAHMAGLVTNGMVTGTVIESGSGDPLPNIYISATASNGQTTQVSATGPDGTYQMSLPPDTYTLRFAAQNYRSEIFANQQVGLGQVLSLDVDMLPCTTIAGLSLWADVYDPIAGEIINFEAQVSSGATPITYSWSFGDGSTGSGAQIMHDYSLPGAYPVQVIANNACNLPAAASVLIMVEVEPVYLPLVGR